MKSIQNQYNQLLEGNLSQANFMRAVRMTFPQFITNVTSFDDSVKILRNKGILNESVETEQPTFKLKINENQIDPNDVYSGSSVDRGETGSRIEFRVVKNTPEYFTIEYKIIPNSRFVSRTASRSYQRRVEEGSKVIYKDQVNPAQRDYIKVDGTDFQINSSKLIDLLYNEPSSDLNEAKNKKQEFLVNPVELSMGIKVEMEHTDDPKKAEKIAMDHLKENPSYYSQLKLSGIDAHQEAPKKPAKKKAKKSKEEFVDKENAMKVVKESQEEINEYEHTYRKIGGVCYKIDDEGNRTRVSDYYCQYNEGEIDEVGLNMMSDEQPNSTVNQAAQFIDMNNTLKPLSGEITLQNGGSDNEAILKFGYWEVLPEGILEKLELQFNIEVDVEEHDDKAPTTAYILTPKRVAPQRDLGAAFEKFKSMLENIVREVLEEENSK